MNRRVPIACLASALPPGGELEPTLVRSCCRPLMSYGNRQGHVLSYALARVEPTWMVGGVFLGTYASRGRTTWQLFRPASRSKGGEIGWV